MEAGDGVGGARSFGFGAGEEVFFFGGTAVTRQSAGKSADGDFGKVGGRGESVRVLIVDEIDHDFVPNGGSAGDA